MPSRQNLFKLSCMKTSQQIVQACINSRENPQILNLLKGRVKGKWKVFSELRDVYNLPVHVEDKVLEMSLQVWGKKERKLHLTSEAAEIVYILIHYFCVSKTAQSWKFELKHKQRKSVRFMFNFNPKNLKELKVSAALRCPTVEAILSTATNLVVLDVSIYDLPDQMRVIGKCCHNVKLLRISRTKQMSSVLAEMLCFQDYPTSTIRNPICTSLKTLHALYTSEALVILLENMNNLRNLVCQCQCQLDYEQFLTSAANGHINLFPCSLEHMQLNTLFRQHNFEFFYENFPNLKYLSVISNDYHIPCNENIHTLEITFFGVTDLVDHQSLGDLAKTSWRNLTKLLLIFPERVVTVNFSILCQNCPNIEGLHLLNVKMYWRDHSLHWNLKKLILEDGTDLSILNQTSDSLETLVICYSEGSDIEGMVTVNFDLANEYPALKHLILLPYVYVKRIPTFLNKFPVLETFGPVINRELRKHIKTVCKQRKWDLNLVHKEDATMYLKL